MLSPKLLLLLAAYLAPPLLFFLELLLLPFERLPIVLKLLLLSLRPVLQLLRGTLLRLAPQTPRFIVNRFILEPCSLLRGWPPMVLLLVLLLLPPPPPFSLSSRGVLI